MDWYTTFKKIKTAKHVSNHSHWCHLCSSNLKPIDITLNQKHHFPWGLEYRCDCRESGIWTNSIRNYVEFVEGITGMRRENFIHGFCNDTFCPFCFEDVIVLENGALFIKNTNNRVYYNHESQSFHDQDTGESIDPDMLEFLDLYGCSSREHNVDIVWRGYSDEYGEGEYEPIYKEYFGLREKISPELMKILKEAWKIDRREDFPL